MTNLHRVLKSWDITFPTKVCIVTDVVLPIVTYGCESWTVKKAVQFSSVAQSCPTLCDPMNRSTLGLPVHHQLLESIQPMSLELVMPSNHLILCCPLLLPSTFPSIRVFSNESVLHIRWPKYWSFSFNISPSSEHSGLISFRMDWCIPWSFPNTGSYDARNASTLFTFVTDFFVLDLTVTCMKWLN